MMKLHPAELESINQQFENTPAAEILRWAWEKFGTDIAATSSFQTQSLPLLHLIAQTIPDLPILFLDTGFHFPETLTFRNRLVRELGVKVQVVKPAMSGDAFYRQHGELYRENPDLCCYINKVEPLKKAKKGLKAWISGIRRDQTQARTDTAIISLDQDGLYKICPMATWTRKDIWTYITENQLPEHPLLERGYLSIGCAPCTRPVFDGENERDGRWAGQDKIECGIHISLPIEQENVENASF